MEPTKMGDLVKLGSLELATSEPKPWQNIDREEHRFALAVREPKLRDIDEPELKKTMLYIYLLIGLRPNNYPGDNEKEFIHRYIRANYGQHTAAEVALAFDMAIQGTLDIDPRDVNCYENFSIQYFARIMGAYRSWAKAQARKMETNTPPPPTPVPTMMQLACWKLDAIQTSQRYQKPFKPPLK